MRARASLALLLVALPLAGCLDGGLVGGPAPRFELTLDDGRVVNETTFRGRFVILDMMATWCLPCRLEVGHLQEVQRAFGDDVVIISVGSDPDESMEDLGEFARRYGASWPHALDVESRMGQAYGLNIIPKLVVIDPEGTVVFEREGEVLPGAIARVIDPNAPPLSGEGPSLLFAIALLAAVLGFLAAMNPYRRFHREGGGEASAWAAVGTLALLAVLGWRLGGLVSSRATYGSLLIGAMALGGAVWWLRARRKTVAPPKPHALLAGVDRAYEAAPHFALALVMGLSSAGMAGYVAPLVGFLAGLAAGVASRSGLPEEARERAGVAGLALAGAGLLVFGARVFLA